MNSLFDEGISVIGRIKPEYSEILTPDALRFVAKLSRTYSKRRIQLLQHRTAIQDGLNCHILPDFLSTTREIRESAWEISPIPADLQDRRVEITGPAGDAKMVINAFNSGANVFMADFEDAQSPTWDNVIQGQKNLRNAIRGTITFSAADGRTYQLNPNRSTLMVRPRGWHLDEKHVHIDGAPVSASLFDFGLYFFHNLRELLEKGTGPYFYLPKLENHLEARLWNDVFLTAQQEFGIPSGTIKATVLIETILAAFEMDEILYELREHSAGLNCGRWDYIFSVIKKFHRSPEFVLPDRALATNAARMRWVEWQRKSQLRMMKLQTQRLWQESVPTKNARFWRDTMERGWRIPDSWESQRKCSIQYSAAPISLACCDRR